jgi:hypothetical protein
VELNFCTSNCASLRDRLSPYCPVFPLANGVNADGSKCDQHLSIQTIKGIIAMFAKIYVYRAQEEFDEIEFTMILWKGNGAVTSGFNHILHK